MQTTTVASCRPAIVRPASVGSTRAALSLAVLLAAPLASAETLEIGTAGDFTLLALNGGMLSINSATTISGAVGAASNATVGSAQKAVTFLGQLYLSSGTATTTFQAVWAEKNFAPSGGILYGPGAVDTKLNQASADALAAASYYESLIPTSGPRVLGAVTSNLSLVGGGGLNVYAVSSWSYNSHVLTLTGGASDLFVFDVTGSMDWSQSRTVLNGLNPNQVLFNFVGGSSNGILVNKDATVFKGTILSPRVPVIYHNPASFNGRILAGSLTLHSAFNITGPPPPAPPAPPIPPPTGRLDISSNVFLQGVTIPVGYSITRSGGG